MITGKKFDPAPLEDAIRACFPLIDDALIFGNGQSYPGVLLFRSSQGASMSDKHLCAEISPIIEKLNRESQSHARIPRYMLIPMPPAEHSLEKSSKGTILRGKAEERYAENIAKAYENVLPNGGPQQVSDEQVSIAIRSIILNVVGERTTEQDQGTLSDDTDLFAYGIDSVGCIQIRHALSHLIPNGSGLPLTVVEDQGTISRLSDLILRMRSGQMIDRIELEHEQADQQQLMLNLAKEYSSFNNILPPSATRASTTDNLVTPESPSPASKSPQAGLRILLTGPTGSLGSHILHQLLFNPRVSHIHLLVRGARAHASCERVLKALSSRLLPISADSDFDAKTTLWQCKLSDAHLGLSDTEYTHLRSNIDVIIHLAWSVNFLLPLRSFAATHLSGLRNLIDLALSSPQPTPPRVVFCSSVASVSQYPDLDLGLNQGSASAVPERPMSSPASAGPTGYARSKWVAEAICVAAHRHTRLRNRISIARVGQLSGATDTGVWSKSEAYPLMLSSMKATGVLPALQGEVLNWLPVDLAARAFVEDVLSVARPGGRRDVGRDASAETDPDLTHVDEQDEDEIPVHHVLNPNNDVQWSDLLSCLSRRETFKTVPVHEWLDAVSALQHDEKTKDHPSLKLLGFWKTVYSSKSRSRSRSQVHSQPSPEADGEVATSPENSADAQVEAHAAKAPIQYGMKHTYDRMPCLKTQVSQVMKEEYMLQLWDWIKENV
jgi:thioester reductase-like protein/aryl carrier-like protein